MLGGYSSDHNRHKSWPGVDEDLGTWWRKTVLGPSLCVGSSFGMLELGVCHGKMKRCLSRLRETASPRGGQAEHQLGVRRC